MLTVSVALAMVPAMAQTTSTVRTPPPSISNPGVSFSTPPTSPLQAQQQDNYATQLRQEQFQLRQQNPSGVGRAQWSINNALSGFTPQ
jgi:hypothetical protein